MVARPAPLTASVMRIGAEMSQVTPYLVCLALLGSSCASHALAPPGSSACERRVTEQDDDIVAPALIHLFTLRGSSDQSDVYFVGIVSGDNPLGSAYGLDPSAALLRRLAPYAPAVRTASAASPGNTFTDRATGGVGILFVASNICWQAAHRVELDVTVHFNPDSRTTYTLQLSERRGEWGVESCVVTGESCTRTA